MQNAITSQRHFLRLPTTVLPPLSSAHLLPPRPVHNIIAPIPTRLPALPRPEALRVTGNCTSKVREDMGCIRFSLLGWFPFFVLRLDELFSLERGKLGLARENTVCGKKMTPLNHHSSRYGGVL
eukprot:sb/3475752/